MYIARSVLEDFSWIIIIIIIIIILVKSESS